MKFPDLSALEDLPEKTQQMQDSLHRIEALLRVLIEVQTASSSTYRKRTYEKHGLTE